MMVVPTAEDPELEALLNFLKGSNGFDFTGYKRTSLKRRILKRMQSVNIDDFDRYRAYLEANPDEFAPLFNTILINVSSFFRDTEAWEFIASNVIPRVLDAKPARSPIRVWSAACAAGQEPYSMAILLAEALGIEDYSRRVKIYATDLDEDALEEARRARYPLRAVESVPEALRTKYFLSEDDTVVFHSGLRRSVIFGRQDLVEDAPISHVDLLLCRNALMYFNVNAQTRILTRLHFALSDTGFLILGRAEMLLSHLELFAPVELKHRVFTKVPGAHATREIQRVVTAKEQGHVEPSKFTRLRDAALDAAPVAQIVFDDQSRLVLFNERASAMFGLGRADFGKLLQDLELSYRPVDLRSLVDKARELRMPASQECVEHRPSGADAQFLDVVVTPLSRDGIGLGVSITFNDVTRHQELQQSLLRFGENLETAYEELQSANEELETTNEELQSSNEELETTNEELQAANEEMETVNEELRSTNEELSSTNDQLRRRETDLNEANDFLSALLGSLRAGVVVTNADLNVLIWNDRACDMWGLRADEVQGRPLLHLDIGLPLSQLEEPIRACMADGSSSHQIALDAVNRRGRGFRCHVTVNAFRSSNGGRRGAIVLMDEWNGDNVKGGETG
jgi:two-component system, chemotaxis family, CheB/CheR fusion protein